MRLDFEITATQDEGAFFDDYVRDIVAHAPPSLPAHDFKVGPTEVHWHEVAPFVAHVAALGPSDMDELFAVHMLSIELGNLGYRRAHMEMTYDHSEGLEKTATWDDVYNKAARLVRSGNVTLHTNGQNSISASVQGDHGTYPVEIKRDDPNSSAITSSHCECDWGNFQNMPRTRQWKQFQDRPCAHILAAYWKALATPMDTGGQGEPQFADPFGTAKPPQQGDQMSLPGMGGPEAPSGPQPTPDSPIPQGQQNLMDGPAVPWEQMQRGNQMQTLQRRQREIKQQQQQAAPPPPPTPEQALPQFPMDPSLQPQHNPISTPGGKAQSPLNPAQYPQGAGGTFSSWRPGIIRNVFSNQAYNNGDIVELQQPDWGTQVGRSEEHGAGQPFQIPAGQTGEVLGTHPSTGMVNVLYTGEPWDQNGEMQPYGATAWHFPSYLKPRPDVQQPGPAIRRYK